MISFPTFGTRGATANGTVPHPPAGQPHSVHAPTERPADSQASPRSKPPLSEQLGYQGLVFHAWDYPFTAAGKVLLGAFCMASLAGGITPEVPVYHVPVAVLALVLAASTVGSVFRLNRVRASLTGETPAIVGEPFTQSVSVRNSGPLPLFDCGAAIFAPDRRWESQGESAMYRFVGRGESVELQVTCKPLRRGLLPLPPLRVYTTYPFNIGRNEVARIPARSVRVRPAWRPLTRLRVPFAPREQRDDHALAVRIGHSPEYFGNRDYQPGDSLRHIDFRSWARLGRPVVREYHDEQGTRVGLFVDLARPGAETVIRGQRASVMAANAPFEATLSLTVSVTDALLRMRLTLGSILLGTDSLALGASRDAAVLETLLDRLAVVEPVSPADALSLPRCLDVFRDVSGVLCLFHTWDPERQAIVDGLRAAQCRVVVILVRPAAAPVLVAPPGVELVQVAAEQVLRNEIDAL